MDYIKQPLTLPFQGGCNTAVKPYELPLGRYSMTQNVRGKHPGFIKRPGQIKLHSTADGSNKVVNLYQFRKRRVDATYFLAQMSDGDLLKATNDPPTVTTGVFGAEVHDGGSGQVPASFSVLSDVLIYSNGSDQHQVFAGAGSYVDKFIVFNGTAAPASVPTEGEDYSVEVSDGQSSVAVLDGLDTYANYGCIFIRTPVPCKNFVFTVSAANANASTMSIYYWKNDNTWAAVSGLSDGTASGSTTLAQTGTVSFTAPTDQIPYYAYGSNGWWYQLRFSAALDAEVEVSSVTFEADFQDIVNVWDGVAQEGVEVQIEGTTQWEVYSASAVDIGELASGKKIMIAATDPICGIYFDPGATPNATGTGITSLKYWNGAAWATVGTVVDATSGLSNAGWMRFPKQAAVQPRQFEGGQFYAYWYELILDSAITAYTVVSIQVMPYFTIDDFGRSMTNVAWKDRVLYTFDLYSEYIYASAPNSPMTLNGLNYGILETGDGRSNKIVGMRRFYNEVMVFQEERGPEGGTVTLFQGYSPTTWGKLVLSSYIGAMNNKSIVVVDGVLTQTATDERLKTLAFWLSRHGVCVTDGKTVSIISDEINNYFDPTKTECIRRGYEDEHWLSYDPTYGVLRIGLVSGSSATVPNIFPVFDLTDKSWSFDVLGQELSCVAITESSSGNYPITMVGGGTDDGFVYQLNYGNDDVSTAVDSYVTVELNNGGVVLGVEEMQIRCEALSTGNIAATFFQNGVAAGGLTIPMQAMRTGDRVRRYKTGLHKEDQNISLKFRNNEADQAMRLHDLRVWLKMLDSY
jgi:hypothetical protein